MRPMNPGMLPVNDYVYLSWSQVIPSGRYYLKIRHQAQGCNKQDGCCFDNLQIICQALQRCSIELNSGELHIESTCSDVSGIRH